MVRLSLDEFKPQELKDVLWGFAHMGIQPDMTVLEVRQRHRCALFEISPKLLVPRCQRET